MSNKKIKIRPKSIKPDYKSRTLGSGSGVEKHSGFQGMKAANNICKDDNSIAYWGDRFPDKTHSNNRLRWYPNTVTSYAGSYNKPSPFNTSGWTGIDKIPSNAKVKKITIHYRIAHIKYTNAHVTNAGWAYNSEGGVYYYNELPSNRKWGSKSSAAINFTISLHKFGSKTLSFSGDGLHVKNRITKNADTYSTSDIGHYSHTIYNDKNGSITIKNFSDSYVRFVLPRQLNDDVSRIVMRDLWLELEYEETPPKFQIDTFSTSKATLKNCDNDTALITLKIKSTNSITDDTQVKITGTGIRNATITQGTTSSTDNTLKAKKDSNDNKYLLWTIKKFSSYTAKVTFYVHYNNTGKVNLKASIVNYKDTKNYEKELSIQVNNCIVEPTFNFEFLNNNMGAITSSYAPYVNGQYNFLDSNETKGFFRATLNKAQELKHTESVVINMGGLELNKGWTLDSNPSLNPGANKKWSVIYNNTNITDNITITEKNGQYTFTGLKDYITHNIIFICQTTFDISGSYVVTGKYSNTTKTEWSKSKTYHISVKGAILGKEYFKLRLEDGSDVRYNSLMITEGDDLLEPIIYDTEEIDNYINDMIIIGEKKRIPVGEIQYIKFDITLNTEKSINLKNVLTYISVYRSDDELDDVIVGAGKGLTLLESDNDRICVIDSISSDKTTTVKLAVKSDIEVDDVEIRLKPFNYDRYNDDNGWIPAHILFKDIPNIKISIDGISDLEYDEQDENDGYFWLYYNIENLSDTAGKNVRFQIKEPSQFKKIDYSFLDQTGQGAPWFNPRNRIITFPVLEANSKKYVIAIKYKATKKGVYNFIIHTLDDILDIEDDQYSNSYQHTLMVNIDSDVRIQTDVSNSLPYVNELIDFHINVKNFYKNQEKFIFEIYDIGAYEHDTHLSQDYLIEYVNCPIGTFTPADSKNKIGTWTITDIKAGAEYDLTLSVRPQDTGNHFFKTIFINKRSTKDLYNEVKVLERNKQLEFDVYHAIDETGNGCKDCDALTKICDDDFINLNDDIYYVIDIKNNSRNDITNTTHIYARLPESFLGNKILCSSHKYDINQDTNLIHFSIPKINGCQKNNSNIKICFQVKPSQIGIFHSVFTLVTRNAKILYKKLNLTVDTEFKSKKLEHEITIYNFAKTNKYYRYEVDNNGDIYKFFNKGDKSYRQIQSESYNKSAVEVYRGSNLRELVRNIKKHSKYVDPVLLREGSNSFLDKAYELNPDGLIRRFGLLNSEVYHYSNQFPQTTDLVLKAMKWDIDLWDNKLWASDKYDNGVFDLTIDYAKVPSNFNILDVDNPIKNLQDLVDNTKPYGTKAVCYYSASVEASIAVNIKDVQAIINHDIDVHLSIPDNIEIVSEYNRHDNSLAIYHDLMPMALKIAMDDVRTNIAEKNAANDSILSSNIDKVTTSIYSDTITKKYTAECFDLISNTYNNTKGRNIDIKKPYTHLNPADIVDDEETYLQDIQCISFTNNLLNKEIIGLEITPYRDSAIYTRRSTPATNIFNDDNIKCIFTRDDINSFNGFQFIVNNQIQQQRNFHEKITKISIQVQKNINDDNNIIHFWGSINEQPYYHIGYAIINDIKEPVIKIYHNNTTECDIQKFIVNTDEPITFQISDDIKELSKDFDTIYAIEKNHKWNYLKRINQNHNQYAYFENKIDIDPECLSRKINIPKLALRYNNFDVDDYDEIVDIKFKIEAQSNKKDFEKDININLYKNGNAYIPNDNIAQQIYYPTHINNINQKFMTTINVEQPSMTICSHCLKTSLGYHDTCQYCGSKHVSHHAEPKSATACYNCGWITDGWHEYCPHCLSYNIEKIQIDFNKTYCKDCQNVSDNYYERCPQCFSANVLHLTNTIKSYHILDENSNNIEPIVIRAPVNENNMHINLMNTELALNYNTEELSKLAYINLVITGNNQNPNKYYYCEACNKGGIGNFDSCPHCNSTLIHNEEINSDVLEVYPEIHGYAGTPTLHNLANNFTISIPLEEYAKTNKMDKFKLLFYLNKPAYAKITNDILKLPIDDFYQAQILESLLSFDITVDNIYFDYKYIDDNEWVGLDKLQGNNHTYIHYNTSNNVHQTDALNITGFNIPPDEYTNTKLYISGLIKKGTNDINNNTTPIMNLRFINNNTTSVYKVNIRDTLFNYTIDITQIIGLYLKDIQIQIDFDNVICNDINLTDIHLITEKHQYDNQIHDNVNDIASITTKENNYYLIESMNNNLWGINNEPPYYLSGVQLDAGLIAYIDFGKLDLEEYLRIYNIDMIVYYKSKTGQIITDTISPENDATYLAIQTSNNKLDAIGRSDRKIILDEDNAEQIITGSIEQTNGEILGSIDYPALALNNLDVQVTNINEDDDLVNDIPLKYKLAQSFIALSSSISTVSFNYLGKRGYPNNIINAYLCKDKDNAPGTIIQHSIVLINGNHDININFDIYNLNIGDQYWIVLEDLSANNNNYHRFKYNNNTTFFTHQNDENNEISLQLIHYENDILTYDENSVLSFAINKIDALNYYWYLPATWQLNLNQYDNYKIRHILYRYNIAEESNVMISSLNIKSGYYINDYESVTIDEPIEEVIIDDDSNPDIIPDEDADDIIEDDSIEVGNDD